MFSSAYTSTYKRHINEKWNDPHHEESYAQLHYVLTEIHAFSAFTINIHDDDKSKAQLIWHDSKYFQALCDTIQPYQPTIDKVLCDERCMCVTISITAVMSLMESLFEHKLLTLSLKYDVTKMVMNKLNGPQANHLHSFTNKIHFVWVGGPILPNYLQTIQHLAAIASISQFEVHLWVDDLRNFLKTALTHDIYTKGIHLRIITELEPAMHDAEFYKHNDQLRHFTNCVQRELIGFKNKASASDFIRMEILRQEGGYYLDTDTRFKLDINNEPFIPDLCESGFLGHGTFSSSTSNMEVNINVNNDLIAATQNSYILKEIILRSLYKYTEYDRTSALYAMNLSKKCHIGEVNKYFLSKMDFKRKPFKSVDKSDTGAVIVNLNAEGIYNPEINRYKLTLDASGPRNFIITLADWIESVPLEKRSLTYMNHSIFFKKNHAGETIIAGKVVENAKSEMSWVKQQRTFNAFDDTALMDSKDYLRRKIHSKNAGGCFNSY